MSHTNDLSLLVEGIYRPSILYIPNSLFPDTTPEQEMELLEYRVVNDICILKENGDTAYSDKCIPSLEMFNKRAILENNFYQLLKLKDSLSHETFRYLLNEYNKNVHACKQVYGWLVDNMDYYLNSVAKEELELFKLQYSLIIGHMDKVINVFGNEITEQQPNSAISEINTSIFIDNQLNELVKLDNLSKTRKVKEMGSKKSYVPSNSEVDKYLLETVFNVDFSGSK